MPSIKKLLKNPYKIVFILDKLRVSKLIPDKAYLKIKYRASMGKKLDLKNPKTFNEKLNWLKLNDRNSEYTKMVDKYEAKEYVAKILGDEYIIPTLGVWDNADDIDFDSLPNQFVLKCTHDSGGLVICRDKSKLNIDSAREALSKALKTDFYFLGREWPYKNVKKRIIAEEYMEDSNPDENSNWKPQGLTDYKFYCFNGEPKCLYVSTGMENHSEARMSFVTMDWKFAPFGRSDYKPQLELPQKPTKFDEMKDLAKKLAEGTKFVRIDLYEIDEKVYFSEVTFYPCCGYMPFEPEEWDEKMGEWVDLA